MWGCGVTSGYQLSYTVDKWMQFILIMFLYVWCSIVYLGVSAIHHNNRIRRDDGLDPANGSGEEDWSDGQLLGEGELEARRMKRRHDPHSIDQPMPVVVSTGGQHQQLAGGLDGLDGPSPPANKPYFEATWPRNVSVILGQPVALKCRTRLLGDRMVCTRLWYCLSLCPAYETTGQRAAAALHRKQISPNRMHSCMKRPVRMVDFWSRAVLSNTITRTLVLNARHPIFLAMRQRSLHREFRHCSYSLEAKICPTDTDCRRTRMRNEVINLYYVKLSTLTCCCVRARKKENDDHIPPVFHQIKCSLNSQHLLPDPTDRINEENRWRLRFCCALLVTGPLTHARINSNCVKFCHEICNHGTVVQGIATRLSFIHSSSPTARQWHNVGVS